MKIIRSKTFDNWLSSLRDGEWKARIAARIGAIEAVGHFGDTRYLRDGVSELRFKSGAGYRVYYAKQGAGDKSSQRKDIENAVRLLEGWHNG